jgi:hypothetical protein
MLKYLQGGIWDSVTHFMFEYIWVEFNMLRHSYSSYFFNIKIFVISFIFMLFFSTLKYLLFYLFTTLTVLFI